MNEVNGPDGVFRDWKVSKSSSPWSTSWTAHRHDRPAKGVADASATPSSTRRSAPTGYRGVIDDIEKREGQPIDQTGRRAGVAWRCRARRRCTRRPWPIGAPGPGARHLDQGQRGLVGFTLLALGVSVLAVVLLLLALPLHHHAAPLTLANPRRSSPGRGVPPSSGPVGCHSPSVGSGACRRPGRCSAARSAAGRARSGSGAARPVASGTRWSRSSTGRSASRRSSCRSAPTGRADRRGRRGRVAAALHRLRRARPGARRRAGPRLGHPGRGRARGGQVDAAAAGGARRWPSRAATVLYVSAEESPQQVRLRAERLGTLAPAPLPGQRDRAAEPAGPPRRRSNPICWWSTRSRPSTSPSCRSAPGSVAQVRECAAASRAARPRPAALATVLVGHVTKDGGLAGPRVLEHVVDTVLAFEGDRHHALRLLRAVKHRFGSTDELGLFEMTDGGLPGRARRQRPVPGRPATGRVGVGGGAHHRRPPTAAGRGAGSGRQVDAAGAPPLGPGPRRRPAADAAGRAGSPGRRRPGQATTCTPWPWVA